MEKIYNIKFCDGGLSTIVIFGKKNHYMFVKLIEGWQHEFPNVQVIFDLADGTSVTFCSHLGAIGLKTIFDGALSWPATERYQRLSSIRRLYLRFVRSGHLRVEKCEAPADIELCSPI